VVLSWKKLPAMGISIINHLEIAVGHDEVDEYGSHPAAGGSINTDGRSTAFALGIQPLAQADSMGGFSVSSLTYAFAYETLKDFSEGVSGIKVATMQNPIAFVAGPGEVLGDHTYMFHSLSWSPVTWMGLAAHLATYDADADSGPDHDYDASEVRVAATMWLWGPKRGMMGGSATEGGIYVSPMYSVTEFKPSNNKGTNSGVAVVYNVPGGWMQIHGVWDSLKCDYENCSVATAEGKDSANVFTVIVEYKF